MLDQLPPPSERRLAVRVTKDALRQIRGGHPWVFDKSITDASHHGAPGDLAVIFDAERRFAAIGLWDPHSPIRIRVLHAGKPTPIDETFWATRIGETVEKRRPLVDDPRHSAYRLIHGENDRLPSLVVDQYGPVVVVKLYSEAWLPHLQPVVAALTDTVEAEAVVLRFARNVATAETFGLSDGATIIGPPVQGGVPFVENGLEFEADPVNGQKTGYFLDQRDNRQLVRAHSAGASVLDVFCCQGGFGVHAAAGGATDVHSTDLSPHAIRSTEQNMSRNASRFAANPRRITTVGDAFEVMQRLQTVKQHFDLVIIDPPSFAQRKSSIETALKAYDRLTQLGVALTNPGGLLFQASCSSRVTNDDFFDGVFSSASRRGARLEEIERTGHAIDHPVGFAQGSYLKAILARVDH